MVGVTPPANGSSAQLSSQVSPYGAGQSLYSTYSGQQNGAPLPPVPSGGHIGRLGHGAESYTGPAAQPQQQLQPYGFAGSAPPPPSYSNTGVRPPTYGTVPGGSQQGYGGPASGSQLSGNAYGSYSVPPGYANGNQLAQNVVAPGAYPPPPPPRQQQPPGQEQQGGAPDHDDDGLNIDLLELEA